VLNILAGKELPMATPGFTLTYNQQGGKLWEDQIQTSKVQAQFIVTETEDHEFFQNLAVEYEGDFAIVIYKNNELFYVGRIIADQMQYERRPELNTIYTITAVDGLSQLGNFKIQKDWFDATSKRLGILDLIRLSIGETFVPAYYNLLGFTDNYIQDMVRDLPTGAAGFTKVLEFNQAATIENLTSIINFNDGDKIFIDTKKAITELLKFLAARLIYSKGMFIIYDPITIAENNFIFAFNYDIDGNYTSRPTVNTQYLVGDGARPCFSAFPIFTHQPPQLRIEQTYVRKSFDYVYRRTPAIGALTLSYPSIGNVAGQTYVTTISGVFTFFSASFSGIAIPKQDFMEINFRVYVDGGVLGYKYYDLKTGTWSGYNATIPFYEKIRCEVTNFQQVGSNYAEHTIDFYKNINSPSINEIIVADVNIGNLSWNWATGMIFSQLQFKGLLQIYEEQLPTIVTVRNDKNTKATEVLELSSIYGYEWTAQTLKGIGTLVNVSGAFPTGLTGLVASLWAERQIAVYIDAPKVAQATLIDDGDYSPILCPNFDDDTYIFNGGTFDAQSETWNFELLRIAQDVVNIDTSELDNQDEVDINDQQNNAVFRLAQQVETNRNSVSNLPNSLPYDVMRVSPDVPTVQPTVITNFAPVINYDVITEELTWNIQELGKVQSLTGGTHDLDVTAELIICDTTAENIIINLPDPATVKGRKYHFKKITPAHNVQLNGTIDGLGLYAFNSKDDCKVIMSDGTQYWLVAFYHK
jgi:hypothetical protein